MTESVAAMLGGAFERGCASIGHGLEAIAVALRPSLDAGGCTHPDELRDHAASTMGCVRWTCTGCGFAYEQKVGR